MIPLFKKLTSGTPEVRSLLVKERSEASSSGVPRGRRTIYRYPAWAKLRPRRLRSWDEAFTTSREVIGNDRMTLLSGIYEFNYFWGQWKPCTPIKEMLPVKLLDRGGRTPLMRSPDRKQGFGDINRETSRIKSFRLRDAIVYSYFNDPRFVLVVCAMIGITAWWALAPEPLLLKPGSLATPDMAMLSRVVKDTFIHKVCSSHNITSPCECGEPLNSVARKLFEEPEFDPLALQGHGKRTQAFAVLLATILISLALTESVSPEGLRVDF